MTAKTGTTAGQTGPAGQNASTTQSGLSGTTGLTGTGSSGQGNQAGQVALTGRAGFLNAVLRSPEARAAQVDAFYQYILHRDPDPTGLNSFANSNLDLQSVRVAMWSSPEFLTG